MINFWDRLETLRHVGGVAADAGQFARTAGREAVLRVGQIKLAGPLLREETASKCAI